MTPTNLFLNLGVHQNPQPVGHCIEEAHRVCGRMGVTVYFTFEGVLVTVNPGDSTTQVFARFMADPNRSPTPPERQTKTGI